MPAIRTVGIFSKPNAPAAAEVVPRLLEWIAEQNLETRLDEETARYAGRDTGLPRPDVPEGCDLVIVLGGDGTLLSAARAIGGREVPLFPVNLGGLGFLTAITLDELFAELRRALRGEHRIGKRKMLKVEIQREGLAVARYEALNDAVITKSSLARMIDLEAHADQMFICAYKADGLIVATATGSTAYSLSAGGPIIFPSVAAFCLTPICPHMLTNRPVIVPETMVIRIVNRASDGEAYLTIDGQVGEPLRAGDQIVCRTSTYAIHLVRPPRMMFFDVLREKLKWGER
ncbi:MAG: NAD(+)/NADH kinase [Candidatus Solibacter usitatus]|nr:NAD(+)/NADH kinase [Candidatus Solibacter usitatus]